MTKKRSPREIIEATPYPEVEHSFYKIPGKDIEEITNYDRSAEKITRPSPVPGNIKEYTGIHTHPTALSIRERIKSSPEALSLIEKILCKVFPRIFEVEIIKGYKEIEYGALPSGEDINTFLKDKKEKATVIAVREPETRKVRGYTIVRKTKKTPKIGHFSNLRKDIKAYREGYKNIDTMYGAFENLAGRYNLKYRFLPASGYILNETKTQFIRKNGLEQRVLAIIAIVGLGSSLFFLGAKITGNVITDLSTKTPSFLGLGLSIISLIAGFFWLRKHKF